MAGKRVRFLTGTDEHGEKIALAAAGRGMSPKEHCDSIVGDYKALWGALDIAYDGFIRTTDSHHEQLVAEVLQRVWDKVRVLVYLVLPARGVQQPGGPCALLPRSAQQL
jgi:methionyl-tRNA synthetase